MFHKLYVRSPMQSMRIVFAGLWRKTGLFGGQIECMRLFEQEKGFDGRHLLSNNDSYSTTPVYYKHLILMRDNHPRSPAHRINYNSLSHNHHTRTHNSLASRPIPQYSPRNIHELKSHHSQQIDPLKQMRIMKSRMDHTLINSQVGRNDGKLFPPELLFLLGNEEGNVDHFRNRIKSEKQRVERDFQNLSKQIQQIIQDLKLSIQAELDIVFQQFLTQYKQLKSRVSHLREARRKTLQNAHKKSDYFHTNDHRTNLNNQTKANNISNVRFLEQASKDEQYLRNHQLYEEINQIHMQALGPILAISRNIISLGSQQQLYCHQKGSQVIHNIRDSFFEKTKSIFESQLPDLVVSSQQIFNRNNQVLNGISSSNIDQKGSNNDVSSYKKSQKNNNISGKNKKNQSQVDDYDLPIFKNKPHQNPYHLPSQNQNTNRLRPYSSSQHHRLTARDNLHRESQKREVTHHHKQKKNKKYIEQKIRVSRNQQNVIYESHDNNLKLIKNQQNPMITCTKSKGAILCAIFINNGKSVAIGSRDTNIYVYSIGNGNLQAKLSGHSASICTLSNFNHFFASGGDTGCCSLAIWDTAQLILNKKVKLHNAAVTCIVDLGDGVHLATAGYDKQIIVYNYVKGQMAFDVSANKSSVASMAVSTKSRKLVSGGLDLTLSIWNIFIRDSHVDDIRLERIVPNCGLVSTLRPLTLLPDIVLAGNQYGKILFINLHNGEISKTLAVGKNTVLQMIVFERMNKPAFPLLLSFCAHQKDMVMTQTDTGVSYLCKTQQPVNILHGCGVGPMIVVSNDGMAAVVSQLQKDKMVRMYKILGVDQ